MVDNHFVQLVMYFVSTKSVDCWIPLATEAVLCSAFLDAGAVDNITDIEIWRRQSYCDGSRLLAGKI